MGKLFLLFVIMPIMEIAVLIHVGDIIGGWNTVLLVILSAMIGAYLVKREGVATLAQAQVKIAQGQVPAEEIGAGLLLLIAGVLLVTPGFITDILGLLLTIFPSSIPYSTVPFLVPQSSPTLLDTSYRCVEEFAIDSHQQ